MENTAQETSPSTAADAVPQPGDPRHDFAIVTGVVAELIANVDADQFALITPCPEFTVADVLAHIVGNQRSLAALGRGEGWQDAVGEPVTDGFAEQFAAASHEVMEAWTDPAKLGEMYEVPWGVMPGAALVGSYVGEQAVHGWDIAQATGQTIEIDDAVLQPALDGLRFGLPAEGRGAEIPFGPVVVPESPDASTLDHLAGWSGRQV
ncbi:MAG: TIGR03086 family metal-binding protein [Actinomycetota bacterium]